MKALVLVFEDDEDARTTADHLTDAYGLDPQVIGWPPDPTEIATIPAP